MIFFFLPLGRFLGDSRGAGSVGTGFVQSQALFGERGGHLTERGSGVLAYVMFLLCDFFFFYFFFLPRTSYLIGQGVEGWSFSCIKTSMGGSVAKMTRGGVSLDDDFSTVVGSSFGALSEAQLLSLDLQTHTQVSHDWESGHMTKMCCS